MGRRCSFRRSNLTAAATQTGKLTLVGNGFSGTTGALEMIAGGASANTISGAVYLLGDTTISVDSGQLTLSGIISGSAALTKMGSGYLDLSNANVFNGQTTVSNGILEVGNASGLGAITAPVVVNNGATLDLAAVAIVGKPMTLNGNGFGGVLPVGGALQLPLPRGTLVALGAASNTGNVTLGTSDVVLSVDAGALTITGIVSGTNLTVVGAAASALTLNASNTFTGAVNVESGTLVLTNQNVYTGTTTIATQSQLKVNGFGAIGTVTSSGTLTGGSTTYNLSVGSAMTLDDSVNNLPDRINPASNISLTASTLILSGNSNVLVNTTQTVGTVTIGNGNSVITTNGGAANGASVALTITNLVRNTGGTVNFTYSNAATGSSLNQVILNAVNGGSVSMRDVQQ